MIPNLDGYPNFIAEENIKDLKNRTHALGKLPVYSSINEPRFNHEELLASCRYKFLIDEYCRAYDIEKEEFNPMMIMMSLPMLVMKIMNDEYPHKTELIKIAEEIVRTEYNLSKDEVIFNLEILDSPTTKMPKECNTEKSFELDEVFPDDIEAEIVKRRIINGLIQGAAKKGHFMFHLAGERLNEMIPGITKTYQQAIIANDLLYYLVGDKDFCSSFIDDENASSYVKLNFDGDIPVIEAKAFSFPILVHEMVKGVIELLATQGQAESEETAKMVLDLCDLVKAEMWCCRLGTEFWVALHELIDIDHYDIKKLILMDVFKMPAEEFNDFFYDVLNNKKDAQKVVSNITSSRLSRIVDYNFDQETDF